MEANDMLCYSNSAKMQPYWLNVDKHEKLRISSYAKKKATMNEERKKVNCAFTATSHKKKFRPQSSH